jgi:hypothetical protein
MGGEPLPDCPAGAGLCLNGGLHGDRLLSAAEVYVLRILRVHGGRYRFDRLWRMARMRGLRKAAVGAAFDEFSRWSEERVKEVWTALKPLHGE